MYIYLCDLLKSLPEFPERTVTISILLIPRYRHRRHNKSLLSKDLLNVCLFFVREKKWYRCSNLVYVSEQICDMSINDVIHFQCMPTIFHHKSNIFSNIAYSLLLGTTIKMRGIYILMKIKWVLSPQINNK